MGDVDAANMESTLKDLQAAGVDAITQKADVTSGDSMNALAKAATEKFGGIDLVFANGGIGAGEGGNMWDYDFNDWEWGFRVNTWGVIHTINAFMPISGRTKQGSSLCYYRLRQRCLFNAARSAHLHSNQSCRTGYYRGLILPDAESPIPCTGKRPFFQAPM